MTARARGLARHAGLIRRVFGAMVIGTAAAMYWQVDVTAVAWLTRVLSGPSSQPADSASHASTSAVERAPEFGGIEHWLNSAPLTMSQLRGKVVLIDFWTYGCVNCVNTLPYVKSWYARYKDQGLVVVGVHTPEYAFERETGNVQRAILRHGIDYPVAQDNHYATWTAWGNQYWPAVYLVDRDGHLVFSHAGEGDYETIEQKIREALARTSP